MIRYWIIKVLLPDSHLSRLCICELVQDKLEESVSRSSNAMTSVKNSHEVSNVLILSAYSSAREGGQSESFSPANIDTATLEIDSMSKRLPRYLSG